MAMATNNIELGSVEVYFKASGAEAEVDMGYTNGGAKITVSQETVEIEVDQLLDPIDEMITKRTIEIEVPVISVNVETLQLAFPGSTIVTDKTDPEKRKLVLGSTTGSSLTSYAGELRLHPVENAPTDHSEDYFFPCAAPMGNLELSFTKNDLRTIPLTFKAFPAEVEGQGKASMVYGDPAASAS